MRWRQGAKGRVKGGIDIQGPAAGGLLPFVEAAFDVVDIDIKVDGDLDDALPQHASSRH